METFVFKALQLIAALSLLVLLHELGHYLFARLFGIRVDKFYLFFNPGFSLLRYNPATNKLELGTYDTKEGEKALATFTLGTPHPATGWRATVYGIGWLPLGGYCKIAGMVDESMDKEQLKQAPKADEFRSRPAYQRLLVMLGGVLFNFITAIVIYIGIAFHWGSVELHYADALEGFDFVPAAVEAGFMPGDIPLTADGKPVIGNEPDAVMRLAEAHVVTVLRNHRDTVAITLPDNFIFRLNEQKGFLSMRVPMVVDKVVPGRPAAHAGLKHGDRITAIGDIPTPTFTEGTPALQQYAGQAVPLTVLRDGRTIKVTATPDDSGKLGFQIMKIQEIYPATAVSYTFWQAIPKGWEIGTTTLGNYVGSMKHLFSREGAESIGGFGAIGDLFPERWNWLMFWEITAFLSVALAFMNIIPIPGLDGGHVLFLLWEMVTRRQPSERFMEIALYIGMTFLLLLLVYANGMDIIRAFR